MSKTISILNCDSKRESGGGLLEGHTYAGYSPAMIPPTSLKNSKPSQPFLKNCDLAAARRSCGGAAPQSRSLNPLRRRSSPQNSLRWRLCGAANSSVDESLAAPDTDLKYGF